MWIGRWPVPTREQELKLPRQIPMKCSAGASIDSPGASRIVRLLQALHPPVEPERRRKGLQLFVSANERPVQPGRTSTAADDFVSLSRIHQAPRSRRRRASRTRLESQSRFADPRLQRADCNGAGSVNEPFYCLPGRGHSPQAMRNAVSARRPFRDRGINGEWRRQGHGQQLGFLGQHFWRRHRTGEHRCVG